MEYSSFDFGTSSGGFKSNYVPAPDHDHSIDAAADFFSFADASGDFEHLDSSATEHSLQLHQHAQKIDTTFHEPQLTPSGRDGSAFTGSSVLTGHNPEYAMSPLQISSHASNMVHLRESNAAPNGFDGFADEEVQKIRSAYTCTSMNIKRNVSCRNFSALWSRRRSHLHMTVTTSPIPMFRCKAASTKPLSRL